MSPGCALWEVESNRRVIDTLALIGLIGCALVLWATADLWQDE